MNKSIWVKTVNSKSLPALEKELETDILIIGGGLTGMNLAYLLKDTNLNYALVEARKIGSGVTSKSTAKITYLQGNLSKIKNKTNNNSAKLYNNSQIETISQLLNIIKKENIICDLEENVSYLSVLRKENIKKLAEEYKLLKEFNADVELLDTTNNIKIKGNKTYVFNPLKYLEGLKKILLKEKKQIYESTKVTNIIRKESYFLVTTEKAIIRSKIVVVAANYPFFLKPFFAPLKLKLEKSYLAAKTSEHKLYNEINIDQEIHSKRYYKINNQSYEIILLNSHILGLEKENHKNYQELKNYLKNYNYLWTNIDVVTEDYLPIVGKIAQNLYIATGYNTWGMTNSLLAAQILKDLLLNKKNKYLDLLSPSRKTYYNLPKNIFLNSVVFLKELIKPTKQGNVRYEKRNNIKVAIYTDQYNHEHIVKNQCPHLKCGVIFNEEELTWECPCHSSIFDLEGRVIKGPSNFDITYNDKK